MDWELILLERTQNSNIPIFKQIATLILRNIELGLLRPGDKLPTEREVSERLCVARGTVKSAFKRLEKDKIIETIHGSGSYVLKGRGALEFRQKKEALEILYEAIHKVRELDFSEREISDLFESCLDTDPNRSINIAIIDNNLEAMLDLKTQLSDKFPKISFSVLILESITVSLDPEYLLENFDLIITDSAYYNDIQRLSPNSRDKIIEAVISASKSTLIDIVSLARDSRIGIICRTNAFLQSVKDSLLSFQFDSKNIQSFFETDYTTTTYFPGGIDALISFNDAHIFTNSDFEKRNEALLEKGGKLIRFEYQIQEGSLIYIEHKINTLIHK